MNGYMAGGIGVGVGQAAQNVQRGMLQAYDIKTRRELQAKEQSRADIRSQQQTSQFEQESKYKDMQMQQMQMQLKQLTDNTTKRETYDAFSGYRASNGDVKYLNNMLKNQEIRKRMNGANGVYKLDPTSQEDRALLKKNLGLTDEVIDSEDFDPTRYVKTTRDGQAPGTFDIVDLYGAYAKTGYMNTMKKEEINDLALKSKQLQTRQQELQVGSAEDWMKANPDKTYQDYLQSSKSQGKAPSSSQVEAQDFLKWKELPGNENKTFSEYEQVGKPETKVRMTTAALKNEYADLEVKKSKGALSKDEAIRRDVLEKLFNTDNDEKRQILTQGMEITDKYKGNLFADGTDISNDDILKAKLYAQQAGIKPDTKSNRELKDQFNTVKTGRRLVEEVNKLDDEELSRGLYDTGIQKLKKLMSDNKFKEMSPEDQEKAMKSINMNTKLGMFLAKYIKSISGTAVAQSEYDRLTNLFSGSSFDNTQALKEGVKTFVDELDTQFRDTAQTSLLDNPSTTLDLVKRYIELPNGTQDTKKTPSVPKAGEIKEWKGKKYKANPDTGKWEEIE